MAFLTKFEVKATMDSNPPEKCPSQHDRSSSAGPRYSFRAAVFLILSLCILYRSLDPRNWFPESSADTPGEFQWHKINPSKTLKYTDCFEGFQCARLDVPLDWNNTDGPRASMAVIKLPAKVGVFDERYGGVVLVNPGGPGGSGVEAALTRGRGIQTILDSDIEVSEASNTSSKYFDIMSFDPRGVKNSSPKLTPFPDAFSHHRWGLRTEYDGTLGTDFEKVYARAQTLSASLSVSHERDPENGIGHFANTSPVVADMVEFIEQHGKWREAEARAWLSSAEGRRQVRKSEVLKSQVLDRTKWRKGQEKLLYWGFSYGTVLGATFSAMQPHRVGRVILDGNVGLEDYYRGDWLDNLHDTDAIMDKFSEYCHAGGPESCPFYDSSASAIIDKLENLLSSLQVSPKGVIASETRGPEMVTHRDVMMLIRETLYAPLRDFPRMANLLDDLVTGNGSAFADFKNDKKPPCLVPGQSSCEPEDYYIATGPILCTDSESLQNKTKKEFKAYLAQLKQESRWMGDSWAEIQLSCLRYQVRPKWKFAGPIAGNTSHPLLLLNPTLDPVTAIANAHVTASRFPGSVVLEQNSEGHCTYAAPSLCTGKHVRKYFQTGELPEPGTVCLPEARPFIGSARSPGEPKLSPEDRRLLDALEELTRVGA